MKNIIARNRRARKPRAISKRLLAIRLSAYKSTQHMHAQIIDPTGKVLASASTVTQEFKAQKIAAQTKTEQAAVVGKQIAEKAVALGITKIAFDRSGFKYHGRIKSLADAAREGGLEF
jgi:large subunit ribosomal protein L18